MIWFTNNLCRFLLYEIFQLQYINFRMFEKFAIYVYYAFYYD